MKGAHSIFVYLSDAQIPRSFKMIDSIPASIDQRELSYLQTYNEHAQLASQSIWDETITSGGTFIKDGGTMFPLPTVDASRQLLQYLWELKGGCIEHICPHLAPL